MSAAYRSRLNGMFLSSSRNKRNYKGRSFDYSQNLYPGKGKKVRRSPYFRTFRDERKCLRDLETSSPSSLPLNRKEYRAIRFIYYCVLPHLVARLRGYEPDLVRLKAVEKLYFFYLYTRRRNSQFSTAMLKHIVVKGIGLCK